MKIDIFQREDNWQAVNDSTMNTIGKTTDAYPDSQWKKKLLRSGDFARKCSLRLRSDGGFPERGRPLSRRGIHLTG